MAYALRHPQLFPIDVNQAPYEMILRIPGVGVKSARKIVAARRHGQLRYEHLKKMGIVIKRARYFLKCADKDFSHLGLYPEAIRKEITQPKSTKTISNQLSLFGGVINN
jgi:predicted DNA-binding helix-hairpin-helix protein